MKRKPRSTKLDSDQSQMLEVLFNEIGKIEVIAKLLKVSETSVSRWRRHEGVDHGISDHVTQALTLGGVESILGRKPMHLPIPPQQGERAARASAANPEVFKKFIEQYKTRKAAAQALGAHVKSLARWLNGARVDHSIAPRIWAKVIPDYHTPGSNMSPLEEINQLFETGRRLHFDKFRPVEAFRTLSKVVFHPQWDSVPAVLMLDLISVIMSIYRQSTFVTEQSFVDCADVCLKRLFKTNLRREAPHLPAHVCAVAWELIAVNAQRGQAAAAVPFLRNIDFRLNTGKPPLWSFLAAGRDRQIRRMMHWGPIVAVNDIAEVRRFISEYGNPLAGDLGKLVVHQHAEQTNTEVQRVAELLRFAANPASLSGRDKAIERFESSVLPVVNELSQNPNLLRPRIGTESVARLVTPSTAMGAAFQAAVIAVEHDVPNAREMIDRAVAVAKRINEVSHGAVFLHHGNPEMLRSLRRIRAQYPHVADFQLVAPVRNPELLHRKAIELLKVVDDYFACRNSIAIP